MSDARDRLLVLAVEHFAAYGVRDTSLRTVAAAIGTSQRMLHYHFGSREDLLAAVVEQVATAETATLDAMVAEEPDPFTALQRHWVRVRDAAPAFGPLVFELATHAMHGRPYAVRLTEVLVTRYAAAFTRAYATMTGPEHAARLARLSLGVGRGLVFDLLLDGRLEAADAAVEEFTAMVRSRLAV